MKKYYIYSHTRLDNNEIFYIGLGTNYEKVLLKRAKSKYKRNKFWNNVVNKTSYKIDIIFESDSLEIVRNKEIELIKFYGRRDLGLGSLVNLADGGEGNHGFIPSEEFKSNISKRNTGKSCSKETKEKMSLAQKGKFVSKETGQKISNSKKNKSVTKITSSFNKRVKHIPSNEVFASLTKAAYTFNFRRNTLAKLIKNNELNDFIFITNEEYCKIKNIRNTTKERLFRNSKKEKKDVK